MMYKTSCPNCGAATKPLAPKDTELEVDVDAMVADRIVALTDAEIEILIDVARKNWIGPTEHESPRVKAVRGALLRLLGTEERKP